MPYLSSVLTLRPGPAFVAGVPPKVTLHLSLAWVTLALVPFTRLVHMFTVPFSTCSGPHRRWCGRAAPGMIDPSCGSPA